MELVLGLTLDQRLIRRPPLALRDALELGRQLAGALEGGRQAFDAETFSDSIVAVLEREPDWQAIPASTAAPSGAHAAVPAERSIAPAA